MTPILTLFIRPDPRRKDTPEEIDAFYERHGVRWFKLFAKRKAVAERSQAQAVHRLYTPRAYPKCKAPAP
ncbi:hypothetical protein [Oceanicola sp. 502str15]|uniref:hypothetical protein n=1 Tax=Oceanicola sp. 502str15 TaxID=2696061 RepID=UPI0020959609|nr:hypothetical protein [Oceanicola sp. 502str15]MCO6381564.1 hypothetical protein [Oceanicola sp. 502str15]